MKFKHILVAIFFTTFMASCGSSDAKSEGSKAGKDICDGIQSGKFSATDMTKLISDGQKSMKTPKDASLWLEGYMDGAKDCL